MRKHLSPAMIISLIALFFALTGGAFAAQRYIITSTKQIKPSVLTELRGKTGPKVMLDLPAARVRQVPPAARVMQVPPAPGVMLAVLLAPRVIPVLLVPRVIPVLLARWGRRARRVRPVRRDRRASLVPA